MRASPGLPAGVAVRLDGGSKTFPMVTMARPTAPVSSKANTVTIRPGGAAAVNTPAGLMVSLASPWRDQVIGWPVAPSERVAARLIVLKACPDH